MFIRRTPRCHCRPFGQIWSLAILCCFIDFFFIMILFHILFTFSFNLFILISHLFSFSPLFLPLPLSLFPTHSPSLSFSLPHSLSLSLIHPHRLLYLPQPSLILSGNDPLFRDCSHPVTLSIGSGGGVGVGGDGDKLTPPSHFLILIHPLSRHRPPTLCANIVNKDEFSTT